MAEVTRQAKPDEEYRKQVLTRYEARHRSFSKQFSILVIFALSFIAFILVPMIAFKLEADRVDQALEEKNRVIEGLQKDSEDLLADQVKLQKEQDSLNGKLTSLVFAQRQKKEGARRARSKLAEVGGELHRIEAEMKDLQDRLRPLRSTEERLERALGRFLPSERAAAFKTWFAEVARSFDEDPDCADPEGPRSYFACMVERKLQADWDQDFALIRTEVVTPLQAIEPTAAQSIEAELVQVRSNFEARLEENPDFWHTIDEKLVFMELLSEEWERAFDAIRAIAGTRMAEIEKVAGPLEQELARLGQERGAAEEQLASLEREQAQIEAELEAGFAEAKGFEQRMIETQDRINQATKAQGQLQAQLAPLEERRSKVEIERAAIETRIKTFQSPFGTLPLGLKEAALAFPFIVSASFLVCALLLADLIGLRREYHDQMNAKHPDDAATVRSRVALVAPLWFDPLKPAWRGVGAMILLLLPVAVFFAIVWLIASGWLLQLDEDPADRFLSQFYNGLYLLGTLLLAAGLWRVGAECRTYLRTQAGSARA